LNHFHSFEINLIGGGGGGGGGVFRRRDKNLFWFLK